MSLDEVRAEAARVAAFADLRDVRMWGIDADLKNTALIGNLSYELVSDIQVQDGGEEPFLLVHGTYNIVLNVLNAPENPDDEPAVAGELARIGLRLTAFFSLDERPDDAFSENELNAFGQTTGQFALFPYVRELVASTTGRMGLPPLHLGVMRLSLESRDG